MCRWSKSTILLLIDGGIAALLLAVAVPFVATSDQGPAAPGGAAVAVGLAVLQASCLLWIRRHPAYALAVAALAGVGLEALCPQLGWLGLVAVPLTYVARLRPPRFSLVALGLLLAPTPWKLVTGGWRDLLLAMVGLGLGWAIGELQRGHAERRRAQRRQIVARERARISRELHDVVAHTMSVIVVQAAAADDVFDQHPDQARTALGSIRGGRPAGAHRAAGDAAALATDAGPDPAGPQPGLAPLDALADAVRGGRAAGDDAPVTASPTALPGGVELSAYRIVQESLTNALKHAPRHPGRGASATATACCCLEVGQRRRRGGPAGRRRRRGPRARRHARAGPAARRHARRRPAARTGGFRGAGPAPRCRRPAMTRSGCWSPTTRRWSAPGFAMIIDAQAGPRRRRRGRRRDAGGRGCAGTRPDVVLMDVRMPRLDGIAATRGWPPPAARARGSSCSPPSTSTSTSTRRCAPAPAASCSRTPARPTWSRRSGWWPRGEALLAPDA